MATLPASTKVLNITELLENIIVFLPFKAVLRNRRISKHWHDTIVKSPLIQEALCLRPKGGFDIGTNNPRVEEKKNVATIKWVHTQCPLEFHSCLSNDICYLNPILVCDPLINPRPFGELDFPDIVRLQYGYGWKEEQFQECPLRKMYLTQPPVTHLEFSIVGRGYGCQRNCRVRNAKGITLGDFVTELVEIAAEMNNSKGIFTVRNLVAHL